MSFKFSKKLQWLQSISTIRLHTYTLNTELAATLSRMQIRKQEKKPLIFVIVFRVTCRMA